MISKLKLILLCPVPEDQKPITEYIGLKENPLTNWTTLSTKNYNAKLFSFFFEGMLSRSGENKSAQSKQFAMGFLDFGRSESWFLMILEAVLIVFEILKTKPPLELNWYDIISSGNSLISST